MQVPLQLTCRGISHSDALADHVRLRAERLSQRFERIVSCHVVVELAGHHRRHGDRFHVSVNLGLPGHEIIAGHKPSHDDEPLTAHGAVDLAFDDAGHELEDWVKQQRTHRHDHPASRRIS